MCNGVTFYSRDWHNIVNQLCFNKKYIYLKNYIYMYIYKGASPVAQLVKNPPAVRETWVCSLGWEDPLEEGMATHSSVLAWRIPWTEETGGQSMGSQRAGHD